jgi:tetratricopeptide (TPR) repeat protein
MELANKAHGQTEALYKRPPPAGVTAAQWAELKRIQEAKVHDTLGLIHLIRNEYDDSVFMYEYVVTLTPENGQSQYNLGAAYSGQAREAEDYMQLTRQDEAKARSERAPADRLQGLTGLRMNAEADFMLKRDKAIETLARAVALGGATAQRARPELEQLYRARNSGAASLEELINLKKAELNVR